MPVRNRVAHNRPLDVGDLPAVVDLGRSLTTVNGWDWQSLRQVLNEVEKDPGYIFRATANLITDPDKAVPNNLPTPDFDETSLLGRREERRQIIRALRGAWPVISILGDGGIGKTALALQVCYDLVEQNDCPFEAIVWVSAKNSQLTSTEIVRIESAVEDSLGLFASAASQLGETVTSSNAIDALVSVLGTFPTLLVLDNVETVLDESFPKFLREIPTGSKVLITSRIGVGTENPFKILGLSEVDSVKLMRILAKSRGFDLHRISDEGVLRSWAGRMNHHPAYIKWFISGLQAGQTPERLLNNNGLVLDFCMSNVFDYLTTSAKDALRAMLVVPGAHTLAELAFLTNLDSSAIQQVSLDLTRTNFVTQVRGGASGTALELSDFARAYLRRTLSINADERRALTEKQRQLYAVGGGLQAAHALSPYTVDTIDIRGVGDYSAAKLLRDALDLANEEDYDAGLRMCSEASELAPGYHEAARIEAHIHESAANFGEAYECYSRAKDLAPQDSHIAYFFGQFLVRSGYDPVLGLHELQRAAGLDRDSVQIQIAIAGAHEATGDYRSSMDAAAYAIVSASRSEEEGRSSLHMLWRNCAHIVRNIGGGSDWPDFAEAFELAVATASNVTPELFTPAILDLMLLVQQGGSSGTRESADDFIARRISRLVELTRNLRESIDSMHMDRRIGTIHKLIDERGFGFIRTEGGSIFFHVRCLQDRRQFENLKVGSTLAFNVSVSRVTGKVEASMVNCVA